MSNGKILVTGATGQLGARIVQQLVKRLPETQVVAGGRSVVKAPQGVEFRPVDYDRPATIEAALDGIERVEQHRAVIDTAARAGVRLLAYTSILKADANPLRDDHQPGQRYELAGSTSITKREYAGLHSRKSGRKVQLQDLTEAQYAAALVHAGLPDLFAGILSDSDAKAADGWLFDDSRTLEKAIGRPTAPFEKTLDAALDA